MTRARQFALILLCGAIAAFSLSFNIEREPPPVPPTYGWEMHS